MARSVQLKNVSTVLEEVDYPAERAAVAAELTDVTLVLADGEANLGELLSETATGSFDSAHDIETELNNVLPREAVGEPYQSEGDA